MKVGFVGVGNMGSRIVTLLLDGGHDVTLWARRPVSLEPFAGRAEVVGSPAGVGAASDFVGICVWDESDVDDVVLGDDGVLAGMRPGGAIAIHSTIAPAACRRLQTAAAARDVGVLDAPVSVGANLPRLLLMVGGEPRVLDQCREVFDSIGDPVLHLGPIGSGQIAKLVNNTLLAATAGLAADAVELGGDLGLDEAALLAALSVGSSRGTWSALLAWSGSSGGAPGGRTHEWAGKDVGLTTALAVDAGVDRERDVLRLGTRGVEALSSWTPRAAAAPQP